jgi:hypothetical protein
MGTIEIIGMCVLVVSATWIVSEKLRELHIALDKRLDEATERQRIIEAMVERNSDAINNLERYSQAWFKKIHKDIYRCTIPPQQED